MATDRVDKVEAPLPRLRELQRLEALVADLKAQQALNAPRRPRPWHKQARPDQLPPDGEHNIIIYCCGRGYGKTKLAAEWIAEQAATHPNTDWAIVAPTHTSCRRVCLEGPSGLLRALLPAADGYPAELLSMNASELEVRLTNGSKIHGFSADGYERLRGLNLSGAWVDEMATFAYPKELMTEALLPALRIGENPRVLITTTPRPIRFLRELVAREDGSVAVVYGSTWDNAANLSRVALAELRTRYEGTRAGQQELEGLLLSDVSGALWSHDRLDETRVRNAPQMSRIVVGVDPAVTSGEDADHTGIVVVGKSHDGHIYVLEDLSMKGSPHACMTKAVSAYHRWMADVVVAEKNNGGDYLEGVIRTVDQNVSYKTVTATRGKVLRAEPIAALWEQSRAHIVGSLAKLEDEMTSYTSDFDRANKGQDSPDRLDAMCYAATELNPLSSAMGFLMGISSMCPNHDCGLPNPKGTPACRKCGASIVDAA